MASVYLAHDPNFQRNVAIKLISSSLLDNPTFRERFEREARLIAKIEHPAIVPVYDYGEQDNQLYLVMRYMPGGTLVKKVKQGLTLDEAIKIISQVAPALDAVHAQGVVHRDLKPGNILLDNFDNAAISDFGIAHLSAATTDLTGSAIIGTPSYMSPEQVRGDEELDGRSDIYALGVILFEMLTGRGPFRANTPMSVALKHLSEPLPSILSFRPDLPFDIERILGKAMAKDREMRYATASEMAHDLQAIPVSPEHHAPRPSLPATPSGSEIAPTEMETAAESEPELNAPGTSQASKARPSTSASPLSTKAASGRASWGPLQFALAGGAGLALLGLCGLVVFFGVWAAGQGLSGQNQTPIAAPSATVPVSAAANILFADDFSDPASGWPTIQNDRGGYGYRQDGYHIYVSQINAALWATTNRQDGDAQISVDARPLSATGSGYYGLLCRIQDNDNFYYFVVQNNGDFTIGKYKNAEFQSLTQGWQQNSAIRTGGQSNRLTAECAGNSLRFYANGTLLGEATDTDFASGFNGLVVAALDSQGFEVIFNNFLIAKPGQ